MVQKKLSRVLKSVSIVALCSGGLSTGIPSLSWAMMGPDENNNKSSLSVQARPFSRRSVTEQNDSRAIQAKLLKETELNPFYKCWYPRNRWPSAVVHYGPRHFSLAKGQMKFVEPLVDLIVQGIYEDPCKIGNHDMGNIVLRIGDEAFEKSAHPDDRNPPGPLKNVVGTVGHPLILVRNIASPEEELKVMSRVIIKERKRLYWYARRNAESEPQKLEKMKWEIANNYFPNVFNIKPSTPEDEAYDDPNPYGELPRGEDQPGASSTMGSVSNSSNSQQ